MTKIELPNLKQSLILPKEEIIKFLEKICTAKTGKSWFKKSDVEKTVTLVCHIDTVHDKKSTVWDSELKKMVDGPDRSKIRLYFDPDRQTFWSPDGLGADDRAGFYGILRVYAALPDEFKPNLLFCDEEECGGAGAKESVLAYPEIGESLFLVELDRRRSKDCVFYNDEPDKFKEYIESFGFKREWGSFTDISHLGEEFSLCGTNLSVGFYDEHSKAERLECKHLAKTINKTCAMVESAIKAGKKWPHKKDKKPFVPNHNYNSNYNSSLWRQDDFWRDDHSFWRNQSQDQDRQTLKQKIAQYSEDELAKYPYLVEYLEAKTEKVKSLVKA